VIVYLAGIIALDAVARMLLVEKPFVASRKREMSAIQAYKSLLTDIEVVTLILLNFFNAFVFMGKVGCRCLSDQGCR
jgi:hypothetical protein